MSISRKLGFNRPMDAQRHEHQVKAVPATGGQHHEHQTKAVFQPPPGGQHHEHQLKAVFPGGQNYVHHGPAAER